MSKSAERLGVQVFFVPQLFLSSLVCFPQSVKQNRLQGTYTCHGRCHQSLQHRTWKGCSTKRPETHWFNDVHACLMFIRYCVAAWPQASFPTKCIRRIICNKPCWHCCRIVKALIRLLLLHFRVPSQCPITIPNRPLTLLIKQREKFGIHAAFCV